MKKLLFILAVVLVVVAVSADKAYAPLVNQVSQSSSEDTSVVDLSDKDTDQPTWSPSFENTTPAGSAPGGPIENDQSDN